MIRNGCSDNGLYSNASITFSASAHADHRHAEQRQQLHLMREPRHRSDGYPLADAKLYGSPDRLVPDTRLARGCDFRGGGIRVWLSSVSAYSECEEGAEASWGAFREHEFEVWTRDEDIQNRRRIRLQNCGHYQNIPSPV